MECYGPTPRDSSSANRLNQLSYTMIGVRVRVNAPDDRVCALLDHNFGAMADTATAVGDPELDYVIRARDEGFDLRRGDAWSDRAADDAQLLFLLEKDVTVELQKLRRDLYFLHSAALERDGRAFLLVGESGAGKSTTAWALANAGFRYLSDELAPITLGSGEVQAYPHALCLKSDPPDSFPLPPTVLRTARTIHVRAGDLPGGICTAPTRLSVILFVGPRSEKPSVRPVRAAEATARLYTQALNALAHPDAGLDPAVSLATRATCFELSPGRLDETARVLVDLAHGSSPTTTRRTAV